MDNEAADPLALRYGAAHVPMALRETPYPTIPELDTLFAHRSVRRYSSRPLPSGTLETMIAAAQSASTSSNLQSWSVVAIEDEERKRRAAELCDNQKWIEQAPLFLVWCADLSRLDTVSQRENLPGDALDYTEMFVTGIIDTALAAQNAAVAAGLLGLGTCYIGAARNRPLDMAEFLGLPPRAIALFGLTVGWPDGHSAVKPRLPQPSVLHRERYDATQFDGDADGYNETLAAFNRSERRTMPDWTRQTAERVAGPQSLMGRHDLLDVLQQRGFPLK